MNSCLTIVVVACAVIVVLWFPLLASPQIELSRQSIGYPEYTKHSIEKPVVLKIINGGDADLTVDRVGIVQTSPIMPAWLAVSVDSLSVGPGFGDTGSVTVTLNAGGVVNSPGTVVSLNGEVYFLSNASAPDDSLSFRIENFIVADTVVGLIVDTLVSCGVKLVVDNHGNMGGMGKGGVNLDFIGHGECDPDADVYLFDGGPVVIRKVTNGQYVYSNALYQTGIESEKAWKPIAGPMPGPFTAPYFNGFFTGNMVNRDSSIGINIRYYAPTTGGDSCDFIFQQMKVFKAMPGSLPGVTIGQAVDWNVWSDSGVDHNFDRSGVSPRGFVYMRGMDTAAGCNPDSGRFATQVGLAMQTWLESQAGCTNTNSWGTCVQYTDSVQKYSSLGGATEADWYWYEMASGAGYRDKLGIRDECMVTTYKSNTTLSQDTLIIWTLLTTVRNGNLGALEANVGAARTWFFTHLFSRCCACCAGFAGNVDCGGADGADIGDLTALIDNLFLNYTPLCCTAEANCDGDAVGNIDIGDLTALIDHLFISFGALPPCTGGC